MANYGISAGRLQPKVVYAEDIECVHDGIAGVGAIYIGNL